MKKGEKMKKLLFLVAILIVCSTLIYAAPNNMVMAGGYEVFQVKAASSSKTIAQRVIIVQERMVDFLSSGNGSAPEMKINKLSNGAYEIVGNGISIIDVQKADATSYNTTIPDLAQKWSDAIAKAYVDSFNSFDPEYYAGIESKLEKPLTVVIDGQEVSTDEIGRYGTITVDVMENRLTDGGISTSGVNNMKTIAQQIINYNNLKDFAFTNAEIVTKPVKGIVITFHGLGYTGQIDEPTEYSKDLASKGIIEIFPYYGPWAWMNEGAVKTVDAIVDVIFNHFNLPQNTPIISTGGSMGGLSAIVYTRYAKRTPVACAADSPVCDLEYHYSERPDLPKTILSSFANYNDSFEHAVGSSSPVMLANNMPKIPYYIVHGNLDKAVGKKDHSDPFVSEMKRYGHNITYIEVDGMDHCAMPENIASGYNAFIQSFCK